MLSFVSDNLSSDRTNRFQLMYGLSGENPVPPELVARTRRAFARRIAGSLSSRLRTFRMHALSRRHLRTLRVHALASLLHACVRYLCRLELSPKQCAHPQGIEPEDVPDDHRERSDGLFPRSHKRRTQRRLPLIRRKA